MRIQRRPITLIEILIVMTILALIGVGVGINITKSLKDQRFRVEVAQLVDALRLAQDLMLIMNTDVHLRVGTIENAEERGVAYWLDVEGGLPEKWQKIIQEKSKILKEIHGVFFKDELPFPITPGQLDMRFQSGGATMSRGILRLSTSDQENVPGATVMAVCLRGYPHPIIALQEEGTPIECSDPESAEMQERLTSYTLREIEEDEEMIQGLRKAKTTTEKEGEADDNASP